MSHAFRAENVIPIAGRSLCDKYLLPSGFRVAAASSSEMEALGGAALNERFMSLGFVKAHRSRDFALRKQYYFRDFGCGSCSVKRWSVITMVKKHSNHRGSGLPVEDPSGALPDGPLLKKSDEKSSSSIPEFADIFDEELVSALDLQLESAIQKQQTRHYEIVYLIHEKYASEVQEIVSMINEFVEERRGKIWRLNDWGMRKLAYKIQKARKAHYILMNIEIQAEHINALTTIFEKDERIIRHLVVKEKKAIVQDCPPPPEIFGADDDDISSLFGDDNDNNQVQKVKLSDEDFEESYFEGEDEDDFTDEGDEEFDEDEFESDEEDLQEEFEDLGGREVTREFV